MNRSLPLKQLMDIYIEKTGNVWSTKIILLHKWERYILNFLKYFYNYHL